MSRSRTLKSGGWCRFDVALAVMTLGQFCAAPRQVHLTRLKQVCGYLKRFPDGAIRFRTGLPDMNDYH
ncbi:MAG: hypothetical protein AAGA68_27495, partial [Pseudomonadota bacterium]